MPRYSNASFWLSKVVFLGHIVLSIGISIDPAKVEAVLSWERPRLALEIRSFLAFVGHYRQFIQFLLDSSPSHMAG